MTKVIRPKKGKKITANKRKNVKTSSFKSKTKKIDLKKKITFKKKVVTEGKSKKQLYYRFPHPWIKTGDIVNFIYKNYQHDKKPKVFVFGASKSHIEGINTNYLSDIQIRKIREFIKKHPSVAGAVRKLMRMSGKILYQVFKRTVLRGTLEFYRMYLTEYMKSIKKIDFDKPKFIEKPEEEMAEKPVREEKPKIERKEAPEYNRSLDLIDEPARKPARKPVREEKQKPQSRIDKIKI